MHKDFPHLLSPLRVGSLTLPNRMVMGAMHTRLETLDRPRQRLAAFYVARAAGEIGLMLTGGFSPTPEGVMEAQGPLLNSAAQLHEHVPVTSAVHRAGGRIVLQILHAGRYAKVAGCVSPSAGRARINAHAPRPLATDEVWSTVASFAHTAALAREAGYDGVEIMGSEGYLINEFTAACTNRRADEFGGDFDGRVRLPLEIVKAVRARVGPDFLIVYRISAIDLVPQGMTASEVAELARRIQQAGADLINTGIGWHESAIPTIAASVPRAAWAGAVRNVKDAVSIPVMASNRINMPGVAEDLLASGTADLVSMARPLLADPDFAKKTRLGRVDEINTCIACNQACLDRIFTESSATCLVNPRAGRELELNGGRASRPQRLAVVGGGPAGMSFAIHAAGRGHDLTLFEAADALGGQLNLARKIPGKAEFNELLRYFETSLERAGVAVRLATRVDAEHLCAGGYDAVVIATGTAPRRPDIPGIDHPKVVGYHDVLTGRAPVGEKVAILGAGGIGFDVADFLLSDPRESLDVSAFQQAWGVDPAIAAPGGLLDLQAPARPAREVHMFQRKPAPFGRSLGKSTGWILKSRLRRARVAMTGGVAYDAIDDRGLHYTVDGEKKCFAADTIILCTGQEAERALYDQLRARGLAGHLIGGAHEAGELDAQRAIEQAVRLADAL
ncbi:MAG: NADPH-dependent 2,4-dienoyl-CoA reductase [Alcaligenaceae bacterium]|nr:NADPH-dependent 2,4-dienoyl-CoA reductase [Alcaligenaceae bacterium]